MKGPRGHPTNSLLRGGARWQRLFVSLRSHRVPKARRPDPPRPRAAAHVQRAVILAGHGGGDGPDPTVLRPHHEVHDTEIGRDQHVAAEAAAFPTPPPLPPTPLEPAFDPEVFDYKATYDADAHDLATKAEDNLMQRLVYRGYVDDPRNTDNAWMETVAFHFHCTAEQGRLLRLSGGDGQRQPRLGDTPAVRSRRTGREQPERRARELRAEPWQGELVDDVDAFCPGEGVGAPCPTCGAPRA